MGSPQVGLGRGRLLLLDGLLMLEAGLKATLLLVWGRFSFLQLHLVDWREAFEMFLGLARGVVRTQDQQIVSRTRYVYVLVRELSLRGLERIIQLYLLLNFISALIGLKLLGVIFTTGIYSGRGRLC